MSSAPKDQGVNQSGVDSNNHHDTVDPQDQSQQIQPTNQLSQLHQNGTRDIRIAQRKNRIEANRLAKLIPDKNDENSQRKKPKAESDNKEFGKSKTQIILSRKRIEATKMAGTDLVTNVRVGITARESLRRVEEVKKVGIWDGKRADEVSKSDDVQKDIQQQWEKALKLEGPFQLQEVLEKQKSMCDQLISIKNRLINEYVSELKSKDDEYVKELKRQAEEIDTLLERMENQYQTFQNTLREELEQIEQAFIEERAHLIDTNLKEIENQLEQRKENEGKYMEERAERIDDHIKQLELLRVHDAEEYNLVKIKLETDVQVLEQQLQQMRATYQLNTEKLEYNYQVLRKREEENGTILSAQKRKITRLTDHLNMLKSKMLKQEKSFQQEYLALTDDYRRITNQYKELQKKYRHFQILDLKKYNSVWKLNDETAKELMRKVLQADKIIHEQQLGLPWSPPKEDIFRNIDPSLLSMTESNDANQAGQSGAMKNNRASAVEQAPVMVSEDSLAAIVTAAATEHAEKEGSAVLSRPPQVTNNQLQGIAGLVARFKDNKGYSKTIKKMLELLCNEAGFLVEEKLQKLLSPLHKEEQYLIKLDSIFKALGVETVEDIEKLACYFVVEEKVKTDGNAEEASKLARESEKITRLIHPNDVIRAIRQYVEEKGGDVKIETKPEMSSDIKIDIGNTEENEIENDSDGETNVDENERGDIGSIAVQEKQEKKKSAKDQQVEYWNKMSKVIDEKNYRIWTAVHIAMEKYHSLLIERYNLSQETKAIAQQNEELKSLLRQYMGAKVNEDLKVPPTQILLAQAGLLPQQLPKLPEIRKSKQ